MRWLAPMGLVWVVFYAGLSPGANAADLTGLNAGAMRKLAVAPTPAPAPEAAFFAEDGRETSLTAFAGAPLLVNFWATWCAPCRAEMPSLDALQAAFADTPFRVLTIATGRSPVSAIDRFFDETGVTRLPRHRDPDMALARAMGVFGLPVSVLLDAEGREVARLIGDADWSGPEARAVVEALLP